MSKLRWVAIGCLTTALLLAAPAGARHTSVVDKERCCFELDVDVNAYIGAEYPCDPPGYDCVYPPRKYPNGGHFFKVAWSGREIVSYHERPNGTPLLAEVFAGQARVSVIETTDSSAWEVSDNPDENRSCAVVKSTRANAADTNPKDGWMKSESVADFVAPTGSLEVHAGLALEHVFGTVCGLGIDHHAENASHAAWGGLNQPWVWDVTKPFSRAKWRHGKMFYKSIRKTLAAGVFQNGGFCWDRGTASSLFIYASYFPQKALAAKVRAFNRQYPIRAKRLRTVENQMKQGFAAGPGSEHCNG